MKTYKGNTVKVMAEAADIARRFEGMEVSIISLQREYHCGYAAMLKAILSQMSRERYRQICKKRMSIIKKQACKGNTVKVMAEAVDIARRFEGMEIGIDSLRIEYHCGYPAMLKAILSQMSRERYRQICKKRTSLVRPKKKRYKRAMSKATQKKKSHTWLKKREALQKAVAINDVPFQKTKRQQIADELARGEIEPRLERLRRSETHYECCGCGYDYYGRVPPKRCPKCVAGAFRKVTIEQRYAV